MGPAGGTGWDGPHRQDEISPAEGTGTTGGKTIKKFTCNPLCLRNLLKERILIGFFYGFKLSNDKIYVLCLRSKTTINLGMFLTEDGMHVVLVKYIPN